VAAPSGDEVDGLVRAAAFRFLAEQERLHQTEIPWSVLTRGFEFRGQRVPLLGPQGIFKPAAIPRYPLSITTAPAKATGDRPYDDGFLEDGTLRYRYRGTDRQHHDNVGLRECMRRHLPLVYLHGVAKGLYLAAWPVFVIGDNPDALSFTVDVDARDLDLDEHSEIVEALIPRRYSKVVTVRRLHQQEFRNRVLRAYKETCALCRLKHRELLDAAHITPDAAAHGEPEVSNGISLCKLHHAAFDTNLFGVRPDLVVEVRRDILEESDGPVLLHALQRIDGSNLLVPKKRADQPDPGRLRERYEQFRRAS
jgi:putative restriction endonuclease